MRASDRKDNGERMKRSVVVVPALDGPVDYIAAVKVAAGKTLADTDPRKIKWYVEGVEGQWPNRAVDAATCCAVAGRAARFDRLSAAPVVATRSAAFEAPRFAALR